jgi:hypothetical protein
LLHCCYTPQERWGWSKCRRVWSPPPATPSSYGGRGGDGDSYGDGDDCNGDCDGDTYGDNARVVEMSLSLESAISNTCMYLEHTQSVEWKTLSKCYWSIQIVWL